MILLDLEVTVYHTDSVITRKQPVIYNAGLLLHPKISCEMNIHPPEVDQEMF